MAILIFILILSILVFVHEFGHFLMAKKAGIFVEEFGFGLPPRIWGKKIGETIYSINALPIGGFVKLYGEDGITEDQEPGVKGQKRRKAFFEAPLWRRLTVLLAGVTMNLFLAIVCFSILYYIAGIPTKTGKVLVVGIADNSPSMVAGLKLDDSIISVDGTKITSADQFVSLNKEKVGKTIQLEILRQNDNPCKVLGGTAGGSPDQKVFYQCQNGNILLAVLARQNPPAGEGPLGVAISDMELKKFPWWQMPFLGAKEGFADSISWGKMILQTLSKTLSSLIVQGQIPKDIAGPVGIFTITSQVAKEGFLATLQFLGILSVNLAIMNVLPFPGLDGGRLLFLGYEAIFRKRANPRVEAVVNNLGMIALLSLMALITINDVMRLVRK